MQAPDRYRLTSESGRHVLGRLLSPYAQTSEAVPDDQPPRARSGRANAAENQNSIQIYFSDRGVMGSSKLGPFG